MTLYIRSSRTFYTSEVFKLIIRPQTEFIQFFENILQLSCVNPDIVPTPWAAHIFVDLANEGRTYPTWSKQTIQAKQGQ